MIRASLLALRTHLLPGISPLRLPFNRKPVAAGFSRPAPAAVPARGRLPGIRAAAFAASLCVGLPSLAGSAATAAFEAFDGWVDEYLAASGGERLEMESAGVELARERRAEMRRLVVERPEAALARAFQADIRALLPERVRGLIEAGVSGAGDFDVSVAYGGSGNEAAGSVRRSVRIGGNRYRAYLPVDLAGAASMRDVQIEGIATGGLLAVRALEGSPPPVAASDRDDAETVGAHEDEDGPGAVGTKRVLVMRGTFSNMSTVEAIGELAAYETVEEVHRFLRESSYQQLSFQLIHVTEEVVVLPGSSGGYLPQEGDEDEGIPDETPQEAADRLMADAMDAAAAAGYLNEYDLILAVFPDFGLVPLLSGSDAVGAALVSGPFSFLVLETASNFVPSRVARLFGHNLGLWRSHYWKPIGPLGNYPVAEGRRIVNGNPFDLTGGGTRLEISGDPIGPFRGDFYFPNNHFSGNFKNILGWLPDENVHIVPDGPSTATYRIHRLDGGAALRDSRKYSLRLLNEDGPFPPWVREEDEAEAARLDYWIDYRRMPFADRDGSLLERVRNGVVLQWGDGGSEFGSHLINAHPDRWPVGDEETPLAVGETFYDPFFGLLVTPAGRGGQAPDEYIDLVVTRGTLDVEIRSPRPEPSVVNPEGSLHVSLTETVEFAVEAGASGSRLVALDLWVSGFPVKTTAVSEGDGPSFTIPFRFAEVGEGEYDVRFAARNEAGNVVQTESLRFSARASRVDLSVSPAVVQTGQEIRIEAIPDSLSIEINFAQFLVDGEVIGTIHEAPFEILWTPEVAGTVRFQALVTDVHGREYLTEIWDVTVIDEMAPSARFWAERSSGTLRDLEDVVFASETFVAVGANGTILVSPDGEAWSQRTVDTNARLRGIAYGAGTFVAVGDGGTVFTSADTLEWARQDSPSQGDLRSVAYGGGYFVAVGGDGRVRRSADGETWSAALSGTGSDLNSVTWGAGRFVAVGEMGTILTSETGAVWDVRTSGEPAVLEGVAYGAARFVAVGRTWDSGAGKFRAAVRTSVDGAGWVHSSHEIESALHAAHYGEGLFAAGGAAGAMALSADGIWWRPQGVLTGAALRGVSSADGQFIAVGQGGIILQSVPLSFEGWLSLRFSPEELGDPEIAGADADPGGAGIANLMRYALGIEDLSAGREILPRIFLAEHEGAQYLTLEFVRLAGTTDLHFTVERSTDLAMWQAIGDTGGVVSIEPDGNVEIVTARDGVSIDAQDDRLFLRLRVEQIE